MNESIWDWNQLLDFNIEDHLQLPMEDDDQDTMINNTNLHASSSSNTYELAGACPELDASSNKKQKSKTKMALMCQVPGLSLLIHEEFVDAAKPGERVQVAGIPVILEIQTSLKSEEAEVNQRDSRQGVQTYGAYENTLSFVSISEHQCLSDFRFDGRLSDNVMMIFLEKLLCLETANFGKASLQTNVNGIKHEKLSSFSSLTSSSWTDLSLKMKEVRRDGEKQSKEAKDEDVHVLKQESNFDSICYFFSIIMCKYKDMNLENQVVGSPCERMDQLWAAVCVWRVLPRLGITQDDTTRDYMDLLERLACQLVGVPELVLDVMLVNGSDGSDEEAPDLQVKRWDSETKID
uniref:Uncharacterized protein n=1 Tax=Tanacetum cinerariifolium TaxID=118510 RepID=A0A6L2JYQ2_TANCI|nr:hypothetical protein [Tanacetum cinerariifolium]